MGNQTCIQSRGLPWLGQGAGRVERQPAQGRARLIAGRAIGHDLAALVQPGVMGEMRLLDAPQDIVCIGRRILWPAQQHQLERFKVYRPLSQPATVNADL
jgi:hypothetical protein